MTCELVDYLTTLGPPGFLDALVSQAAFFKGLSNICRKSSYQPLKQKIVDVFLSIAGRLKRDNLSQSVNPGAMKWADQGF